MRPPRFWRRLLGWALDADRRADVAADLAEEFDSRVADGSPRAARRWYRRQALAFAARSAIRPRFRSWVSATDARLAVRMAARQPVATATSVLALAATIGISLGAFAVARSFIVPDLRIPNGDHLQQVQMTRRLPGATEHPRPAEALAWMRGARTVDSVGAFEFTSPTVQIGEGEPRPVDGALITPAAFARLAPPPLLGRHLTDADAGPGAPPVVVIGELLWRSRLSADPEVIGRRILVAGEPRVVVGVLPATWRFPVAQRLWLPLSVEGLAAGAPSQLVVWAVAGSTASRDTIEAELTTLARNVAPDAERDATALEVLPYVDGFTGGMASPAAALVLTLLLVFLGAVSLNVANLTLARCAMRAEELAVRAALGASRTRIVSQLFLEALVVSGLAAVAGVVAAERVLALVQARIGTGGPFWLDLSLGGWEVTYAAALALVASALAGVVPALHVTRGRALTPGARVAPVALGRFAPALLAVQLAASLVLLATAGLLAEGLDAFARSSGAADESRVLTAVLYRDRALTGSRPPWGSPELHALRRRIEQALAAVPGVERAAVSLSVPRADQNYALVEVEGSDESAVRVQQNLAGPGFFETLGVAPTAGRMIDASDARPGAPPVVVVSQRFVSEALHGQPPLGRRLREARAASAPAAWVEIVGVVPDLGMDPGDRTAHGEIYEPLVGTDFMYASLRTSGPPVGIEPALREALAAVDSRIRVTDVQPLADVGWEARAVLGGGSGVLTLVGALALLLSLAGIYALASLSVTSRTREIGIRLALGASTGAILVSVLGRTIRHLGLGVAAGSLLAVLAGRALAVFPFPVPGSVGIFVPAGALVLIGTGLLALWMPARRASRIAPADALRG
jgi:putative ABC transport system permease protein